METNGVPRMTVQPDPDTLPGLLYLDALPRHSWGPVQSLWMLADTAATRALRKWLLDDDLAQDELPEPLVRWLIENQDLSEGPGTLIVTADLIARLRQ